MSDLQVMAIDDDDVEIMVIKRAFRKNHISSEIVVARDGIEALKILRGEAPCSLTKPYLILLDLNLPRMNGIEFLRDLRADPVHGGAVVFVLTTSASQTDRDAAYRQGVAGYVVKSKVGNDLAPLMQLLQSYAKVIEWP